VFFLVYLTFRPIYMMSLLALFFAWLVWCAVGTTRSAIRALRSGSIASKILAIVALALLVVVLVETASQVVAVARFITLYRDV
jgi:hypothetical protein